MLPCVRQEEGSAHVHPAATVEAALQARLLHMVDKHRCSDALACAAGHFHLSHNYTDSIAVAGSCAFVQTGVIGDCNRDGFRHSRVLKGAKPAHAAWHRVPGRVPF